MIYLYTPDMTRPYCPICGCPVPEPTIPEPSIPWVGTCPHGHTHTYQLEDGPYDLETTPFETGLETGLGPLSPELETAPPTSTPEPLSSDPAPIPEPPSPSLLTEQQRQQLLDNGHRTENGETIDPRPVVKLFTPDAGCTWLLTEIDPNAPDMMFGLCDLGHGEPELGYVSLSELENVLGLLGLPVERDLHFHPDRPLSAYTEDARKAGRIIT